MHCSEPQQLIMAKYFRDILVDIYCVDENNPPADYPTLNQLQNYFIIKGSRPKVIRNKQSGKEAEYGNFSF
jgi:hypothetical protein